jgi:hypothetical protein
MRWEWHVASMGEKRKSYRILEGKPVGDVNVGWRIILRQILERVWTGLICFRIGTS